MYKKSNKKKNRNRYKEVKEETVTRTGMKKRTRRRSNVMEKGEEGKGAGREDKEDKEKGEATL